MLKDKKLYIYLLVVLLFSITLIKINYSVDTYLLFSSPKLQYTTEYLSSGRIFTWSFINILNILHIPYNIMYFLSFIIAIFITTISIYELNKILKKYISNNLLATIIPILIIINPFIIELWLYIEMSIMMLSILSMVEAYKHFDNYLINSDKKYLYKALIWMLIGVFSYQGTTALFAVLSTISIIKMSKNKKDFIKNNIKMVLLYIIPTIINYIFIIIFSKNRIGGNINIIKTISTILSSNKLLINAFGILPKGFSILISLVTIILVIYYIIKSNDNKTKSFLHVIYILLITYIFTIAPIIPQTGERIALYPRTCYAFYSFIGILLLFINKKSNNKILSCFIIIILLIELLSFTKIEHNRYIVNNRDKNIILSIEDKVIEYEKSTGKKVNKLAIYNLDNCHIFYKDINDNINVSSIKEQPSGIASYTYYTKRDLKYVDNDDKIYNEYFLNIHDNTFNINQIIIIDDTIHWYLY